ncbi:MAG: sulfotransferase domain-containing protein [Acidobacteria bacterium]|nr:sulfotransferase domain-containing protein [Acidobacteriota bacterium]
MGRRPDFLGLGAQKAATSWIHACLYEHPQVFMPASKEVHFFSRHYEKGLGWYEDHFRGCEADQRAGEISPTYLYDPESPARIHEYVPRAKLIVCLRNPVRRAISAFRYEVKMGTVSAATPFAEALRNRPGYVEHGLYSEQLRRYLDRFDRDQILVEIYDDIAREPHAFMRRIYGFLGVDPEFRAPSTLQAVNVGSGAARLRSLDRLMRGAAARLRTAGLGDVVWRLGRSPLVGALVGMNTRQERPIALTAADEARLAGAFAADVGALGNLLGRDLAGEWLGERRRS